MNSSKCLVRVFKSNKYMKVKCASWQTACSESEIFSIINAYFTRAQQIFLRQQFNTIINNTGHGQITEEFHAVCTILIRQNYIDG